MMISLRHCHALCLLIGGLLVTSQTIQRGNRWVWRTERSPNSSTSRGSFNPFASFTSNEDDSSDISSVPQIFAGTPFTSPFPFPRDSIDSSELLFFNRRGQTPDLEEFGRPSSVTNISPLLASRGSSNSGFTPSPSDTTFSQVSNFPRSSVNNDQRATRQLSLGLAHFTIPSQLGRPVSVTTPTSNHLTQDSEPLISSYSSLDAKSPPLEGFSNGGKSLLNRRGQNSQGNINDLEPLEIKPLPIDISKLPLESTERAEGIRKLWSSLTSRNEFAKLFDSIAGFNRTSIALQNIPFAVQFTSVNSANAAAQVVAQSVAEDAAIKVVAPPEIQPQAQQVRRPQQLQDQRQTPPQQQQQQLSRQLQQQQQQVSSQEPSQQDILRLRHQQLLERLRRRNKSAAPQQRSVSAAPTTTQRPTTTTPSPNNSQEVRREPRQQIPQAIGFFTLDGATGSQEAGDDTQVPSFRSSLESSAPSPQRPLSTASEFQLKATSQEASNSESSPPGPSQVSEGQVPTRVESFVVRKLRLPGNHIANVVFVPAQGLSESNSSREILHSQSVLRFFQMASVQKSIRELNDKDVILVVEEIRRGSEKTYIISTVDGKRVYPKEHTAQSREDVLDVDGNVWSTFLNVFGQHENVQRARPSEPSEASESLQSQVSLSLSRAPLTSADFAGGVENPRAPLTRSSLSRVSQARPSSRSTNSEEETRSGRTSRTPRRQKFRQSEEIPVVKFPPPDVFDPDNFNPFLPFSAEDERTVKRYFPPLSQGAEIMDLSPPEFFTKFRFSPSSHEAVSDREERKLSDKNRQTAISGPSRRSSSSGFSFSEERFIEPRAAPDSARWPWPEQVPLSLDEFFINSAEEDFKRR